MPILPDDFPHHDRPDRGPNPNDPLWPDYSSNLPANVDYQNPPFDAPGIPVPQWEPDRDPNWPPPGQPVIPTEPAGGPYSTPSPQWPNQQWPGGDPLRVQADPFYPPSFEQPNRPISPETPWQNPMTPSYIQPTSWPSGRPVSDPDFRPDREQQG